jgi:EF-P beta-lysylation protein EpmB
LFKKLAQIIPKKTLQVESHWQKELATGFTDPLSLLTHLQIDTSDFEKDAQARRLFPMRVPRAFVDKMKSGDINDPLLLQVLPLRQEFLAEPGFSADPLEEHDTAGKGLLHKYQSRVLLIVRGGCAVNCRYCFRRHFPYQDNAIRKKDWLPTLEYIEQHPEIDEVIFSGGDPLMANDDFLGWLAQELEKLPQIKRLRIHTRLPVVLPNRIDHGFLQWMKSLTLQKVIVLHINHANEIDDALRDKCKQLKDAGVVLFNQAVLLKDINNSVEAQCALNEALFDSGVQPYYLHVLDKVQGAQHFLVDDDEARKIMAQVIARQPGFLVPKLVREIGGQPGKTPVDLRIHP